jgi:hypothetical protein
MLSNLFGINRAKAFQICKKRVKRELLKDSLCATEIMKSLALHRLWERAILLFFWPGS